MARQRRGWWMGTRLRHLRWLGKPRLMLQHPEYFLDRLRLSWLFWGRHRAPGGMVHLSPELMRSDCQPLIDPPFVPAVAADHMVPADVVLGVEFEGDARAYPWWIMDNHYVANDTVGGRRLVILLCPMCSTGVAFDPVIGGRRLTFEQRHIYNGIPALYDHQTGSVWSPYLGAAIRGQMMGTCLPVLPLRQMTWRAWRDIYPETRVLAAHLGRRDGHGSGHTIGSPYIVQPMARLLARWDTRLPHNTLVLGVLTAAGQRAYPLEVLRARKGVVCDELGGQPIVVFLHMVEGSYGALAYSRTVNERLLTFEPGPQGPVDVETGSLWTTDGRAVAGPLSGAALEFVNSHVSEWFIWAAHHAEIDVYR